MRGRIPRLSKLLPERNDDPHMATRARKPIVRMEKQDAAYGPAQLLGNAFVNG